ETISPPCICCPGMSVKVGWCLIHLSSTPKTMRNRLARPYYTRSWSKDGSSRPRRSKARRAWCATVHAYQGQYVIPIKDNNPAVRRDLQEFFEDEGIDRHEFQFQKETTKGHGRLEVREIWGSHADERMVPERVGGDCTSLSDTQNRERKGGRAQRNRVWDHQSSEKQGGCQASAGVE